MDWMLALVVLGVAALFGGRAVVGIFFNDSWINQTLEDWGFMDGCEGEGGGDGGGGD